LKNQPELLWELRSDEISVVGPLVTTNERKKSQLPNAIDSSQWDDSKIAKNIHSMRPFWVVKGVERMVVGHFGSPTMLYTLAAYREECRIETLSV
jgi:hypothetical protein